MIDRAQIKLTQQALRKQLFGFNTLKDFRLILEYLEFTEKYSPMSVWKSGTPVQ